MVLLQFFFACFFLRKRIVSRISDTNVFLFFLKISSLFWQNWQEINLPGNSSLREKTLRPHTQATSHQSPSHPNTTPPLAPQAHPGSSYPHPPLAPSAPQHYTSTSHPHPPHGVSENFVKFCSPNFLSEQPTGLTPSWSAECESPTLALYQ